MDLALVVVLRLGSSLPGRSQVENHFHLEQYHFGFERSSVQGIIQQLVLTPLLVMLLLSNNG